MGRVIGPDKIGTLTHSAGNISLAASRLTIGGQQYRNSAALAVALPALTANTLYFLYVVLNAGSLEMVVSENVNSVGPAGYTAWKLVGAFYSNGISASVAFGAFVNIEGTPQTSSLIESDPDWSVSGFTSSKTLWGRSGAFLKLQASFVKNATAGAAGALKLFIPDNLPGYDNNQNPFTNGGQWGVFVSSGLGGVSGWRTTSAYGTGGDGFNFLEYEGSSTLDGANIASDPCHARFDNVPLETWTSTPLKDL